MLRKLSKPLYSNCVILDPQDRILCRAGNKRMNWYLSRGLAEKISEDPPTIRLKFDPGGVGDSEDLHMISHRDNLCVVCGSEQELTRHHVVPYSYRVHFPLLGKRHTSYDILPVCVPCHEEYEIQARSLRRILLDELKISETGEIETDWDAVRAIKAANAIRKHGAKIPEDKIVALKETIKAYLRKDELTDEDMDTAAALQWRIVPEDYSCASKKVVESQTSIDAFARRWREHFVSTMKPMHLPQHWKIEKRLYDVKSELEGSKEEFDSELQSVSERFSEDSDPRDPEMGKAQNGGSGDGDRRAEASDRADESGRQHPQA